MTPPVPSDKLKITNTWVLFGRKRSGDIFLEDIRRLKKKVEEATDPPERHPQLRRARRLHSAGAAGAAVPWALY